MAHVRQSCPDSGLGFQAKVLETFKVVPFSLDSGISSGMEDQKAHPILTSKLSGAGTPSSHKQIFLAIHPLF